MLDPEIRWGAGDQKIFFCPSGAASVWSKIKRWARASLAPPLDPPLLYTKWAIDHSPTRDPLIFRPNWGPKSWKKSFWRPWPWQGNNKRHCQVRWCKSTQMALKLRKKKTTTPGNNIYTLLITFIAFTSFISSNTTIVNSVRCLLYNRGF